MHGQMKPGAQLCQSSCPVLLLNIIQGCHRDHIFVLIGKAHLHILYGFHQIHKNQAHCGLVDPFPVFFAVYQRIDDIFQKILDLQDLCNLKVKIFATFLILTQNIYQKIRQHIVIASHGISYIKKLRQHHEIDGNIILSRFQDLMLCKLVEKKQLAFIHHDFFSIDDIGE